MQGRKRRRRRIATAAPRWWRQKAPFYGRGLSLFRAGCTLGGETAIPRDATGGARMSVHKVIEVKAQSPKGWEDAARMAVAEAAETVKGIKGVWIEGMQGVVEGGKITAYRVNAKITFEVESNR
jgi:flavin-binding protein dodecin